MVPIVAYNYGARKPKRITKAIKLSIIYGVCIMLAGFAVFQLFPGSLLGIFSASDDMMAIGIPALRTISLSFLIAGFSVVASSVFQALGHGFLSLAVSVLRQLHMQPAVTYVHVSSLGCKFASLSCGLSQRPASVLTLSAY